MQLQESAEMYLETILILLQKNNRVRSIDVCEYMGYSKPSVSRAVNLLKKEGYIFVDSEGFIALSEKGLAAAEKTYEKHKMLTDFFTYLGVDKKIAEADACRIEHYLSDETFSAIKKHAAAK